MKYGITLFLLIIAGTNIYGNEHVKITVSDCQISSNLIAVQLEVTNTSDNFIVLPGFDTRKYDVADNKLTITHSYGLPIGDFIVDAGMWEEHPTYTIAPHSKSLFSVFIANEYYHVLKLDIFDDTDNDVLSLQNGIVDAENRYRTFNRIAGRIDSIEITIGFIETSNENSYSIKQLENKTVEYILPKATVIEKQ